MTEGNFVDYIKVYASSGKGGRGSAHLHREKFVAKGGPDGGDGGRGGHVIVRGDKNLWTLFHLKFKRHFKAEHGGDGGSSRSTGQDGADVVIPVPLGTIFRDADTDEVLFEVTEDGEVNRKIGGGLFSYMTNADIHHNQFTNNGDPSVENGGAVYSQTSTEDWGFDNRSLGLSLIHI